jgi:hypothetical protein
MTEDGDERAAAPASPELPVMGEVQLTEADFVQVWSALPEFRRRRWSLQYVLTSLGVIVLSGTAGVMMLPDRMGWLFLASATAFLLVAGAMWWLPRQRARASWARRAMKATGDGPVRFGFDEEGMSVESHASEHRLAWADLSRWLELELALLVYAGPTLIVVPKRAFTAGQLNLVRELLGRRLQKEAASAPPA